jgi:hypothetical protein
MLRLNRSLNERIYLLSASQLSLTHWKFSVRGQSKRIYEQNLGPKLFSCSCPDHITKHTFCKHLLFLVSRVAVQIDLASIISEDKKNWTSVSFDICASSWINRLKNHINKETKVDTNAIGNDCSVCFEEMKEGEKLVKCITTCKNYFHDDCLSLWLSSGHDTCPLCRAKWSQDDNCNELVVNILEPSSEIVENELNQLSEANVIKCDPSIYKVFTIDEDINISEYCKKKNLKYKNGCIYYQFIKKQSISLDKDLIMMDKSTGILYINNDNLTNYTLFIQAKSAVKKLIKDQKIIYKMDNNISV